MNEVHRSGRIAIVDASSYSLPYDYYYVKSISSFYEVDFFGSKTIGNQEFLDHLEKIDGVEVYRYKISSRKGPVGLWNYLRLWSHILAKRSQYSSIHFQWTVIPLLDLVGFFFIRQKLIFTFHNPVPHNFGGKSYWPFLLIHRLARHSVLLSEYSYNSFRQRYKIKEDSTFLLPHGAMPLTPRPQSGEPNQTKDGIADFRTIVFWGRIQPYKGVNVIERLIKDKRTDDFSFKIIGRWDKQLIGLKNRLIERCEIRDEYVQLSDVEKLFKMRPLFILPYESGSQSGVFYNLLYHKQVFVATDVGEMGLCLRSCGLDGLLFDTHSVESFLGAVKFAKTNYEVILARLEQVTALQYSWQYDEATVRRLYATQNN